ncbi:MAG TPA: shikimate dehydrogenase [Flavobacteriaceae bacterium]|nr:shikimate dehydrogenase [Flavobacteriaceae bacterium]
MPEIFEFPFIYYHREEEFGGFSVTIPYKESIMRYLDELSPEAKEIGAVNCIKINSQNKLVGHNTDYYGFTNAITPLLKKNHKKAMILGTGGASKAIKYALKNMGITFTQVSRKTDNQYLNYNQLTEEILKEYTIIINCTPLGVHPNTEQLPDIPYQYITENHLMFDLIYNPSTTKFLKEGKKQGATIKNGLEMLQLQAEKSWEIWNS